MKIRVSEASGSVLDYMVARCEGATDLEFDGVTWGFKLGGKLRVLARGWAESMTFLPSSNWAQGGPIIEREKIAVAYEPSQIYDDAHRWKAMCAMSDNGHEYGPTPLIAAMRCFVCSKLGDEVDVPDELV